MVSLLAAEWNGLQSKVSPIFMVLFLANSIVKVCLLTPTLPQPLIPLAAMVVRMLYLRQHQMHSLGKLCDSTRSLSSLNKCSPVHALKSVNVSESLPIFGLRQQLFSPEREEETKTAADESSTLSTSYIESKKLEGSDQGSTDEKVPKVAHIKPSEGEPDVQAEKQEVTLTTAESKEANMEAEGATDALTTGNSVAAESEKLEEDKQLPTTAPNAPGPEYELRMRSRP